MTGTTLGSLYYMSPEQIKGAATLDARSDLYSVGVSLYEIVTGKKPFDGDSQFAIMAAHLEKMPAPPLSLDAKLPQALNDVILMSIAKQPEQRFQSAEAFGAALGSVRQSLGLPAVASATASAATATMQARLPDTVPLSQPPGEVQRKSSKRWLWVAAGALATAAALVAVIQFGPWRKTSAQVAPQTAEAPRVSAPETSPSQPPPPVSAVPNPEPQSAAQPTPTAAAPPAASVTTSPKTEAHKPPVRQIAKQLKKNGDFATAPAAAVQPQSPPPASDAARNNPVPPPGPDPAVLQELRERLVKLDARAGAVRSSLQNLKNSQAASGLSLRGDMTAAESRMNHMLDGANSALRAHDAAAAEKFMQSADTELEKLEKFLNL
jgi:serine/threonine-protein kinase